MCPALPPIGSSERNNITTRPDAAQPKTVSIQREKHQTEHAKENRQDTLLALGQDIISYTEKKLYKGAENRMDSTPEAKVSVIAAHCIACHVEGEELEDAAVRTTLFHKIQATPELRKYALYSAMEAILAEENKAANCDERASVAAFETAKRLFGQGSIPGVNTDDVSICIVRNDKHVWCELRRSDAKKRPDDVIIDAYPAGKFMLHGKVHKVTGSGQAAMRKDCSNGCQEDTEVKLVIDKQSADGILAAHEKLKECIHKTPIMTTEGQKTTYEMLQNALANFRGERVPYIVPEVEPNKLRQMYKSLCTTTSHIFGKKPIQISDPISGGYFPKIDYE